MITNNIKQEELLNPINKDSYINEFQDAYYQAERALYDLIAYFSNNDSMENQSYKAFNNSMENRLYEVLNSLSESNNKFNEIFCLNESLEI